MRVWSFRAECQADAEKFRDRCLEVQIKMTMDIVPDGGGFPDVEAEMNTDATMNQMHDILRTMPDSHVMIQTLRECPRAENSMERDTTIW
jgi:hypothetical protein